MAKKKAVKKKAANVKKHKPHKQAAKAKVKKQKSAEAKHIKIHKKIEPMARLLLPLGKIKEIFRTRYGFFLYDGSEFVINTPETPFPWSNILTNGNYGMILTQAGTNLSFKGGMGNGITEWEQDFKAGNFGKFIYIRDNQSQNFWSATWKPVCKTPEFYEVRHGIGYTNITSKNQGIISSIVYYVAADEPVELWQMRIKNDTDTERFLSIFSYVKWDFGQPTGNREFDKFFVETSHDEQHNALFAKAPDGEYAFHSVNHRISTYTCGADYFIGAYRNVSNPRCVEKGMCFGEKGRYYDPAACIHIEIELPPRGEKELLFTVGKSIDMKEAENIIRKYKNVNNVEEEFSRTCHRWTLRLNNFNITTPDEGANVLNNKWVRYQAISAGMSSLGSFNHPKGKISFKDYLINALTLLSIGPKHHRQVLLDMAEKQYDDGSVPQNWDPKAQAFVKSECIEAPLWFIYSVCEHIKETKDFSLLDEEARFIDAPKKSIFEHCTKAVERALGSLGKKGLPPITHSEYIGKHEKIQVITKGESIWLAQLMVYIVSEFIKICCAQKDKKLGSDYEGRINKLKEKVKKLGWDNDRFMRSISSSGRGLGVSKGKDARIFLDTQAWAVISGLIEGEKANALLDNVKHHLYKDHGPVMLAPSFTQYDEDAGFISKLPVGVMENGGVNVEAACWAIWAEAELKRANNAWSIFAKIDPVDRSHRSDTFKLEPFSACGYIDGPDAPTNGLAREPWFNRSGYWMFKTLTEGILGIKPTLDGLLIDPCIPNRWKLFKVRRTFRNAYYNIEVINPRYVSHGIAEVVVDGKKMKDNLIPAFGDEKRHMVKIIMGKAKE